MIQIQPQSSGNGMRKQKQIPPNKQTFPISPKTHGAVKKKGKAEKSYRPSKKHTEKHILGAGWEIRRRTR